MRERERLLVNRIRKRAAGSVRTVQPERLLSRTAMTSMMIARHYFCANKQIPWKGKREED